jgi:hypothetical protein
VSVAASLAVPDNCPEVLLLNTSAANAVLYGLGQPGVTVLVEGTTAARLPAGASVTLAIGMLGDRESLAGATLQLIFQDLGAAVTVDVTYTCRKAMSGVAGRI